MGESFGSSDNKSKQGAMDLLLRKSLFQIGVLYEYSIKELKSRSGFENGRGISASDNDLSVPSVPSKRETPHFLLLPPFFHTVLHLISHQTCQHCLFSIPQGHHFLLHPYCHYLIAGTHLICKL